MFGTQSSCNTDNLAEADRLITEIDRLHSSPQIAQQVLILTRDPDFDIRDVAACLEKDPALAARILRVVNSSRYGLRYPVTNIRQAASYIGQRSIRLITLTFGLVDTLAQGPAKELFLTYWQRALTMAAVASRLTSVGGSRESDDAYTAGLLADIGMLIFAQLRTERYTQLCESAPHGPQLVAEERRAFGFAHPALGARLLEKWDVPGTLVSAVLHHHEAIGKEIELVLTVKAGGLMADVLWTPNSPNVLLAKSLIEETFGIDTDGFIDLALSCRSEIDEAAKLFGVRIGVPVNCDALIGQARQQYADISLQTALELDNLVTAFEESSI